MRAAGLCWLASLLYFPVSVVVALQWDPAYNVRDNFISDLAVTSCGEFPQRGGVCSPWHALMNVNFFVVGLFIAAGAGLWFWRATGPVRIPLAGFVITGLANSLVGIFPLDAAPGPHTAAATTFLIAHVLSMTGLAVIFRAQRTFVLWTGLWVAVSLIGTAALQTGSHFGIGIGTSERLALDVLAIWRAGVGLALIRGITFSAQRPIAQYQS